MREPTSGRGTWREAIALLTVVPVRTGGLPGPRALPWFPAVGALLGLAVGGTWALADGAWAAPVAAVLAVSVDLGLTGLLHLDGLVDSADGLLPPLERGRRLEVMTSPEVGAFGLGVGAAVLLLRVAALASMGPEPLAVAAIWCASRTTMAVGAAALPSARPGGLAAALRGGPWPAVALGGGALALLLGALGSGAAGLAAALAAPAAGSAVLALGLRRLGGVTGDVAGAAGVVGETAALVVLAGRWW